MTDEETRAAALEALQAYDRGDVELVRIDDWDAHCYPRAVLSNGWEVVIFNDGGSWDYVDAVSAPGATRYVDVGADCGDLFNWLPERNFHDWMPKSPGVLR